MTKYAEFRVLGQGFPLFYADKAANLPESFELELTARCNNNCRHCYINLPADDNNAKKNELSMERIMEIADEAISLGALWCRVTGGEPLLREDFKDIYAALKKRGLCVTIFTNATLISKEHIRLFRKYPPRDIEVTVYGVTKKTYEKVTRKKGAFDNFMRGLNLLLDNGVKIRLKTTALRSNMHELQKIDGFCRERTKDYFRFDPLLHLRLDRDKGKNKSILKERLREDEIVFLEQTDKQRFDVMERHRDRYIQHGFPTDRRNFLISCTAGLSSFGVSYDGFFRLCPSLQHSSCVYDLKKGSLRDAWENFRPKMRTMAPENKEFLEKCQTCKIINLCLSCPAHSYLESGKLDVPVDYFCQVAHARAENLKKTKPNHTPQAAIT